MNPKPPTIQAASVLLVLAVVALAVATGCVYWSQQPAPTAFLIDKQGMLLNRSVDEPGFEALRVTIQSKLIK